MGYGWQPDSFSSKNAASLVSRKVRHPRQLFVVFVTFLIKNRYFCGSFTKKLHTTMGVTELKRKGRKNKATANNRVARIKNLLRKPIVKNVDVEAIKADFDAKKK
jgi:hypothetical protein